MSEPADEIIALYRRHAVAWTRARGTALMERGWLKRFRALMPARASVLDIGCGSGEPIARHLRAQSCDLTGADSSPEMIDLFARNFPDAPAHVADMRTLRLERRFDGVLAWDSFFHLSHADQRAMFPIFRDHTLPRAALMFTSGSAHGEAIGILEGEALYHASLAGAEYRDLLDAAGFDVIDHMVEDPTCGNHTIWLAQRR